MAKLGHLEQLWLPRKFPVVNGEALGIAVVHCQQLRSVHIHNEWDIGALTALTPVTFPHLETVSVDSAGRVRPGEGYVSREPTTRCPYRRKEYQSKKMLAPPPIESFHSLGENHSIL